MQYRSDRPWPSSLESAVAPARTYDRLIGRMAERDAGEVTVRLRVAHVFVFNSWGEMLLTELAPGRWGSPVAVLVRDTDDELSSAERALGAATGLPVAPLDYLGTMTMRGGGCWKLVSLYAAVLDRRRPFQAGDFVAVEELARMVDQAERSFTPTFEQAFRCYRDRASRCVGEPQAAAG